MPQEISEDVAPELAPIESAIGDCTAAMGRDDADVVGLADRLAVLKERRARAEAGQVRRRRVMTGQLLGNAQADAEGDDLRRLDAAGRAG